VNAGPGDRARPRRGSRYRWEECLVSRKLFVNLPVRDLKRSVAFFSGLGFEFDPRFTDDSATCMILSDDAYVMLLVEDRFRDFARKPLGEAASATTGIFALSAESRDEVDQLADTALATGGKPAGPTMDHGFMYLRSFYDVDGHHWEVMYMDPAAQAG
jgi:predicted lactoylglutathione lyase